ncbi:putative methyltransferase tdiE [Lasiodiplodia theobromae]|uniref:Putative methyltransferase tdiE n=1 Tax=Lasiodiplodia theobromae TaxID=45133 RepID=A0A5N5DAI2_9PEZI|nr:putative methyltransferase tdiE [Lasiodiplodia theobromae]
MCQPTENPAPQHIEAEDVTDETDSSYEEDLPSTSSLSSSITDYEYENGRRYHSFKKDSTMYFAPNDEDENDRLDLVHHMITLRLGGKLHLAPIKKDVQEVLDLGTGTGIWAIQMGDEYESARILGNDLSPIQPPFVPPNVRFEVDDIEDEWTYTQKFDFIHARYLLGAVRDWPALVAKCFKYLKPGGWIELQDFTMQVYSTDGSLAKDSYLTRYLTETTEGMRTMGVEPEPGAKLAGWVREAGFEDVHNERFSFPVGSWPKDKTMKQVGLFNLANFADGLEGFSMRILTGLRGWKKEEVEVHVAELRKELKNRAIHPQHDMYVVYAQKPLDAE